MTSRPRFQAEAARLLRYVLVGVGAAAAHFLTALGVLYGLDWSAGPSNAAGFLVGFAVSYIGQSRFTFRHTGGDAGAVLRWFAVAAGGLVLSSVAAGRMAAEGMRPEFAVGLVIVTVPLISFLAGRFWVFRSR